MKTKLFVIALLAFAMIFSFPVNAAETTHDCSEHIEAEAAAVGGGNETNDTHTHILEYAGPPDMQYHYYECAICYADFSGLHSSNTFCNSPCTVCEFTLPHQFVFTRINYDDNPPEHWGICEAYSPTGFCFYIATESRAFCTPDGQRYYSTGTVNGKHLWLENCTVCGSGVEMGSFDCFITEGYNWCSYCEGLS